MSLRLSTRLEGETETYSGRVGVALNATEPFEMFRNMKYDFALVDS